MSKKLEAIKKAVFFAKEDSTALATILEGLVSDVVTTVKVSGATSINVPEDESVTENYSAVVFSQYGDVMSNTVTLALKEAVTGVSISNKTVTVANTATADSFTLTATCGTVVTEYTVALVASN